MRIASVVACFAILAFFILGAVKHWAWAGFDKPLYDWMQLLLLPVVLALLAIWFKRIDKKSELAIAQKRAADERTLALDSQQETALQRYVDRMQELLLHEKLRESRPEDEVRNIARVSTLTMFSRLNTRRINSLLAFLREAALVTKDINQSIVTFNNANLHLADLHNTALYGLDFRGANFSDANLNGANLNGANLSKADLNDADLGYANLNNANLSYANLNGAVLSYANLSGTDLSHADLSDTNLSAVNLNGAILSHANLNGATIDKSSLDKSTATQEQIASMNTISF